MDRSRSYKFGAALLVTQFFGMAAARLILAQTTDSADDAPSAYVTAGASSPYARDVACLDKPHPENPGAHSRLLNKGRDAIPALLNGLNDPHVRTRARALETIARIRESEILPNHDKEIAVEIGRQGRHETEEVVRTQMIETLRRLRGPDAVREMKRFAVNDPSHALRAYATQEVLTVSAENEVEFLKKQTADKDTDVQLAAYAGLAQLGDASGRDLALKTLDTSSDFSERRDAMQILGLVGNPEDMGRLKKIADSRGKGNLDGYVAMKYYKHIAVLMLPAEKRLPNFIQALDDPSWSVRHWAFWELYHSADSKTDDSIRIYLKEPGHQGYKEAAEALRVRH